jgi:hypothetical protein
VLAVGASVAPGVQAHWGDPALPSLLQPTLYARLTASEQEFLNSMHRLPGGQAATHDGA